MVTTINSFQALMEYNNKIWHIDYTATYSDPDENDKTIKKDATHGELTITTIYGDTSSGDVVEAMKQFAAARGLTANWDHVKVRSALPRSTKKSPFNI